MKRLFFALLLAIFAVTPAFGANFYWKSSTTDLNMITTPTAGDRGIVVTDAGAVSYWIYNGSAWVQAYGVASNLTGTPALPNGTTATTQTQADNSTKLANTAYVDAGLSGKQAASANLTTFAGITPSANAQTLLTRTFAQMLSDIGAAAGPASSTDNAIARFDSTTGKLLQNSSATIDDSGNISATSYSSTAADALRRMELGNNTSAWSGCSSGVYGMSFDAGVLYICENGTKRGVISSLTGYATLGANTFTGNQALGANSITMTGSIASTGARVTKGWFTDIESTNMPTVGGVSLSTTFPTKIASGTSALGTSQIASGACASIVTTAATGVATTDVIQWGFNTRPSQVTGYAGANTTGALRIDAYPTANNVNFEVCNQTASAITPGAMTLNWRVTR